MTSLRIRQAAISVAALLCLAPTARASCGAAFCMVNTNWDLQGYAVQPGLRLDLRYEYINQNQPMAGSDKVSVGQIPRHHDEVYTVNRNLIGTLDYTFNEKWAVSATLPYFDRSHLHIHNHRGAQLPEEWNFKRIGDARVVGRYQFVSADAQDAKLNFFGVNFGLKLPTGDTDIRNSAGAVAERTLQPGTGTTDAIAGAYFSRILPASDASWFVQAFWQSALNSYDDYRPGNRATIDAGFRYEANQRLGLMLQLNALWRGRDSGTQAEPDDTGGKFLYLSPGVSYSINKGTQVYAFVQQPLYQYVNGVQLTAKWSGLVGISTRF